MSTPWCVSLDRYLGNDLSGLERAAFVAHLEACPGCRQEVEAQERLDQLLVRATTRLEPVPPHLLGGIERRLRSARRRLVLGLAGLAAAALVALGVAVWQRAYQPPPGVSPPQPVAEVPHPPQLADSADPRSLVRVTFPPRPEVIAVPLPTSSPNVTLLWVYPAATPAGPAPVSDLSLHTERNGL